MISRRNFLKTLAFISAAHPFKNVFASNKIQCNKTERALHLFNIHTGERLDIKYYSSGIYDLDAMNRINYLLRCHYNDEIKPIDAGVIDLLCDIKDIIGKDREVHIISGYRSPVYNEYLRSVGRRVVQDSLHLCGLAVDFSIPGISSNKLSDVAKSFRAGGVGKYSDFVHIDIGRIRYW